MYAKEIFNERLISPLDKWRPYGTEELNYVYPFDEASIKQTDANSLFSPTNFYEEIAAKMDDEDPPQAYGQHITLRSPPRSLTPRSSWMPCSS